MTWNPREDAWLSGFADGEACFVIAPRTDRGVGWTVRFQIGLRADDVLVLEQLQAAFGGTWRFVPRREGNPQAMWTVAGKRELAGLVDYFDRFPLRAKKARDYAIWRRAVKVVCASSSGSPELDALCTALQQVRAFRPVGLTIVPNVTESPQLRLVS